LGCQPRAPGQSLSSGRALGILRECFPGRPVIGLDSTDLIWGLGSFHCLTQQEPAGEQLANTHRPE